MKNPWCSIMPAPGIFCVLSDNYVFRIIFIYERQSVGGYGILAIPPLPVIVSVTSNFG